MRSIRHLLSPLALALASCGGAATGESTAAETPFAVQEVATFDEPWAIAVDPGTGTIFVTERGGMLKFIQPGGKTGTVTGLPAVVHAGQGGLGDIAFAPGPPQPTLNRRTIYLSWAEKGKGGNGAAVGRGELVCEEADACALQGLAVIWRQTPKVSGNGHYSHRLLFSPDGKYLFVASGERQKFTPAQDMGSNLGKIVRLLPDGTPAPGNPFAGQGGVAAQVWSLGHRNILGLAWDGTGRLWNLEHGPLGGDELNLVEPGRNYGWPLVSNGDHYDGRKIPRHATRPDLTAPAISWNPVIAPGGMIVYAGDRFAGWNGQVLIAAMGYPGLVRVSLNGATTKEEARYPMDRRIRAIARDRDGSILIAEDGEQGRLLRLVPKGM
jgi:aldose sugar dehydrogenase